MSYFPSQPLIEQLQHEPPHICDWPGCKAVSVNTLYGDLTPTTPRLARYCSRHTQATLNSNYRGEHQL